MPSRTLQEWKSFIERCPDAHILQSPAWGELKSKFGWETSWVITGSLGAQVLFQTLPLGFQIAYIPRGPVSTTGSVFNSPDWDEFQKVLHDLCRENKTVFLKVEPDLWEGNSEDDCFSP
ncbi:MAG: peptidoglycan bridge formation glycyltransferase FemA/FemB family protein, partial [Anaerolineales bacterium]|nr:peptidoglycan bridge formation glycyltransferase FemA/FemB family protein [Anaerolineales bacterium]